MPIVQNTFKAELIKHYHHKSEERSADVLKHSTRAMS